MKRFWNKVNIKGPDDCWEWIAGRNNTGYGSFTLNRTSTSSHRVAWLLTQTEIPEGMVVMHSCDNRLCCNPAHLSLGTQKQNMHDKLAKGRDYNLRKTHCVHGHEFTEENTYYSKGIVAERVRHCKTCVLLRNKQRRENV